MDYLEDIEAYESSMQNAYNLITRKKTLDDVYDKLEDTQGEAYYLPFDPYTEDGRTPDIIDMVVEYFSEVEEYEKCSELIKIKEECSKNS